MYVWYNRILIIVLCLQFTFFSNQILILHYKHLTSFVRSSVNELLENLIVLLLNDKVNHYNVHYWSDNSPIIIREVHTQRRSRLYNIVSDLSAFIF